MTRRRSMLLLSIGLAAGALAHVGAGCCPPVDENSTARLDTGVYTFRDAPPIATSDLTLTVKNDELDFEYTNEDGERYRVIYEVTRRGFQEFGVCGGTTAGLPGPDMTE